MKILNTMYTGTGHFVYLKNYNANNSHQLRCNVMDHNAKVRKFYSLELTFGIKGNFGSSKSEVDIISKVKFYGN